MDHGFQQCNYSCTGEGENFSQLEEISLHNQHLNFCEVQLVLESAGSSLPTLTSLLLHILLATNANLVGFYPHHNFDFASVMCFGLRLCVSPHAD